MSKYPDELEPKFRDSAEPLLTDFKPMSVGYVIQRFIEEMAGPHMKAIGESQMCILRVIQRMPLGKVRADELDDEHILTFAKQLRNGEYGARKKARSPATVNQYIVYLGGALSFAKSAWRECKAVKAGAITDAKPFLVKNRMIGKSEPRKRVPVGDEIERILAHYETHTRRRVPMPQIIAFALVSTGRLGEIARIQWGDIDMDRKDADGNDAPMYMVRDLKHPTKKLGNNKSFPLFPELAEIIRMMPRLAPSDPSERVFKFNAKSASASYTVTKKALGITNLRFHDNRRKAITTWLARLKSPHKVKLISGHETTAILERVYDATDPVTLHAELAKLTLDTVQAHA